MTSFFAFGGRIEGCVSTQHARGNRFVIASPGHTIFQNNELDHCEFIVTCTREEPRAPDEAIPLISENGFTADLVYSRNETDWFQFATIFVAGDLLWRANRIQANSMLVSAAACFEDNPLIAAAQIRIGAFEPPVGYQSRPVAPVFVNNDIRQIPFLSRGPYAYCWGPEAPAELAWQPPSLMWIGADARPVFQDNALRTVVGSICIQDEARPDFGGGGQSTGGNRFERDETTACPWFYADVLIDVGEGNTATLQARDNTWFRDTVEVDLKSGTVECNLAPTTSSLAPMTELKTSGVPDGVAQVPADRSAGGGAPHLRSQPWRRHRLVRGRPDRGGAAAGRRRYDGVRLQHHARPESSERRRRDAIFPRAEPGRSGTPGPVPPFDRPDTGSVRPGRAV
ncbi:MAG: hypothetical protein R3F55_13850 [Alphaproteobacteria bacterium]